MGEVWKARDTRLDRLVAIKFSKQQFSERFEREARAVAQLNHPSIAALFDIGPDYLVFEFVDGEGLDEKLRGGALPLRQVLRWGAQIAAALDTAHRTAIVHRDLKPGNILITAAETVKVLDFGLAQMEAVEPAPDGTTRVAKSPLTEAGSVMGTPHYMSPEQAQGKKVDARSDIFAFGCVLYEMTTGRRAFDGESTASVLAAVIRDEPVKPSELAPDVPRELERLIARCMRKSPVERAQHAGDIRLLLEDLITDADSGPRPIAARVKEEPEPQRVWIPWAVAGLAAVAAVMGWMRGQPKPVKYPERELIQLTWHGRRASDPVISRDGKTVAYASDHEEPGNTDIYLKQPDAPAQRLTREPDKEHPIGFSTDGTKLYFLKSGENESGIWEMPTMGGTPRRLFADATDYRVSPDGRWAYLHYPGRSVIRSQEGTVRELGMQPAFFGLRAASAVWSPDSRFLLLASDGAWNLIAAEGGSVTPLQPPAGRVIPISWLAGGEIISAHARNGVARIGFVHLDPDKRKLGEVYYEYKGIGNIQSLSHEAGVTVFDVRFPKRVLVSIPGVMNQGRLTGEPSSLQQDREYRQDLQISPDHRKLAFILRQDRGNIFERDLESGKERPLLTSSEDKRHPIYSPDGRRIAYYAMGGVYAMDSAGGEVRKIAEGFTRILAWSPDGRYLAASKQRKLEFISVDGAPPVKAPETKELNQLRWSPDGKWLAFGSGEVLSIVPWNEAQGFDPGRALQARTRGTSEGLAGLTGLGWAPDGGSVYFTVAKRDAAELHWLKLDRVAGKLVGAPQLLRVLPPTGISYLQVLPDRLILSELDVESDIWMLRPVVAGAAPREGL